MKKIGQYLALALICAGFAACDNRPDVFGAWVGNMRIDAPGQTKDMSVTYDFGKDGKVNSSYFITISEPLPQVDSLVAAYQINVEATATVDGTWKYVDREDDEVALIFDPSTLSVSIDPEAVTFRSNVLTAEQSPMLDSIKPAAISHYKQIVTDLMQKRQMNFIMEDVKIKEPLMQFEINDLDYTFHRDSQSKE